MCSRDANVDRILRDLSSNEIVALYFGPTLLMSLPLHAADAVEKLRECTSNGGAAS